MSDEEIKNLAIGRLNGLTFGRLEAIGIENLTPFQQRKVNEAIKLQSQYIADNGESGALSSVSILDVSMSFKKDEDIPQGISPDAYSLMKSTGLMCRRLL